MNHLIELDIIKRNGTRNDPKQTYEKMKVNTKYVKALYLLDMNRKDKIEKNVYSVMKFLMTENYLTNIHVILPHKLLKFMVDNLK